MGYLSKVYFVIVSILFCTHLSSTQAFAATEYFVATTGSDSNPGTSSQPFRSIQTCLNRVAAGDLCQVKNGTYTVSLTLKNTGTSGSPIKVACESSRGCTINSENNKSIITGGRVDYYTISGFRFISTYLPTDQSDVSIELGANVQYSRDSKLVGNHGYIFRDCYIEGAIHFFGHDQTIDGCELNGKNIFSNGIVDNRATSYNNTYKNNKIYSYKVRGIWTMDMTDNILIENNTIYDVTHGVDCDGAAIPVTKCKVINNHIYNAGTNEWGSGVFLENCFDCQIEGNTIHDIKEGPGIYAINYGNGGVAYSWHTFNNVEYRDRDSNMMIKNNIIYNHPAGSAIYITCVSGITMDHNTIYNTGIRPVIGFHNDKDVNGKVHNPINQTITNNIFTQGTINWFDTTTSGFVSSNNFYGNPGFLNAPTDFSLTPGSAACSAGAKPCTTARVYGLSDYNLLIANFGKPYQTVDINKNGIVDIYDYNILLQNYGAI